MIEGEENEKQEKESMLFFFLIRPTSSCAQRLTWLRLSLSTFQLRGSDSLQWPCAKQLSDPREPLLALSCSVKQVVKFLTVIVIVLSIASTVSVIEPVTHQNIGCSGFLSQTVRLK